MQEQQIGALSLQLDGQVFLDGVYEVAEAESLVQRAALTLDNVCRALVADVVIEVRRSNSVRDGQRAEISSQAGPIDSTRWLDPDLPAEKAQVQRRRFSPQSETIKNPADCR